jgi:hypothetical protein
MLNGYKKSRYNIYDNLEFLGLNPHELKHFCFTGGPGGGSGDGPGSMSGFAEDYASSIEGAVEAGMADVEDDPIDEDWAGRGPGQPGDPEGAGVDMGPMSWALDPFTQDLFAGRVDAYGNPRDYPVPTPRAPKERKLLPKMNTMALLQDPVRMLPKMDSLVDRQTAAELSKNYLEMLTEAGLEAKAEGKEGLADKIQEELDKGLLADYYTNYDLMNQLEKADFKTFGTGYRGRFEARTGTNLQSLTRDEYGSSPLGTVDTSERGANLAMFQQFALENPDLTAMEALQAFNATQGPDSKVSSIDLGLMGYSPNSRVGPQAQSREDENYRGLLQGLGLVAKGVALGPAAAFSDLMLSGKTDEPDSILGILTEELDKQTGIPSAVEGFYDQFTTDLGKARDTVVDAVQENIVDPVTDFFSRGLDTPEQASISNFGRAEEAFFDPVDIGNPYAGLSTPEFEAQMAFEESQRGLQAEKEAAPGSDAANQLAEALENAAYYDSLMNPAAISPPEPGSFFEGLDPKETQDYIDRVAAPEGVKLVRKRRAQVAPPPPPTVSEQVSAPRTGNFFPGSFGRPTATPRTRTQTIADIYGLSEEDADRMLGIA